MERKPLVYLGGDIGLLPSGDTIEVPSNFSYNKIVTTKVLLIPQHQQMIVLDGIDIEGTLDIEGQLCLIS